MPLRHVRPAVVNSRLRLWLVRNRSAVRSFVGEKMKELRSGRRQFSLAIGELRRAIRQGLARDRHVAPEIPTAVLVFAIPAFVTGICYAVVFTPLAWVAARHAGLEPVGVLLLQDFPTSWMRNSLLIFPPWSSLDARPVLYTYGALYGAIGLVSSCVFLAGGMQRLVVASNGVFFGFLSTAYAAVLFGVLPQAAFDGRLFRAKLSYVLLSYYAASSLAALLSEDELAREKYDFLFSGTQALAAGWVIARGFGPDAGLFAGFLYLGCTFTTLAISELLFRRVFRILRALVGAAGWRAWEHMERERYISLHQLKTGIRRTWREDRAALVAGTALFLVWPLAIAIVRFAFFE